MGIASDSTVRQIRLGIYDYDIERIAQAALERRTALRQLRTTDHFEVGDAVVFNDLCGTPYLRGQKGTVVAKSRVKLSIELESPVGRFIKIVDGEVRSAKINVQPSVIDHVK